MLTEKINQFLTADNSKIDALIESNPESVSITDISKFLGADVASVRCAIENNAFGMSWRKQGMSRHGYYIPTAQFVRWYLNMQA